ncbi:hypothetical protein ONS95_002012 [Cadophora gregata]|uniref:uncharacterized protein n=1 Tax=Cadophora gregata TaxID=51156 RepID=UPI0026DBC768|nr:uncharacterized protein ONS95_002012 [Cadophora gregata]KAK0111667.1 hypothetical protein ONS95_002012 [Cadophora gregata]KAK0111856.1 hypothetical protein ONS96_001124 [Cadophora gregata f. sp. sojae]
MCKWFFSVGFTILYRYNTFRSTGVVSRADCRWADECTLGPYSGDSSLLGRFLCFKHLISDLDARIVSRSSLLKKVMIQYSDSNSDFYVKGGIGKLLPPTDNLDGVHYFENVFIALVAVGVKLRDLTIAIDEQEPGVIDIIRFMQKFILVCQSTGEERRKWLSSFRTQLRETWAKCWRFSPTRIPAKDAEVEHILVQRAEVVGEGDLIFKDPTAEAHGDHISGGYLPTSNVAKGLIDYFEILNSTKLFNCTVFVYRKIQSETIGG